jgi:hypothetical protein
MKRLWLIGIVFHTFNLAGAQTIGVFLAQCFPCFKKNRAAQEDNTNQFTVEFENPLFDPAYQNPDNHNQAADQFLGPIVRVPYNQ